MSDATRIPLLYIAGPYRASATSSVEDNVAAAEALADAVMMAGARVLPIVPHSIGYRYSRHVPEGCDESFWLPATLTLMERCHALLMMPGWRFSVGAAAERARALELGLPVFETIAEVLAWAQSLSEASRKPEPATDPDPPTWDGQSWPTFVPPGMWDYCICAAGTTAIACHFEGSFRLLECGEIIFVDVAGVEWDRGDGDLVAGEHFVPLDDDARSVFKGAP